MARSRAAAAAWLLVAHVAAQMSVPLETVCGTFVLHDRGCQADGRRQWDLQYDPGPRVQTLHSVAYAMLPDPPVLPTDKSIAELNGLQAAGGDTAYQTLSKKISAATIGPAWDIEGDTIQSYINYFRDGFECPLMSLDDRKEYDGYSMRLNELRTANGSAALVVVCIDAETLSCTGGLDILWLVRTEQRVRSLNDESCEAPEEPEVTPAPATTTPDTDEPSTGTPDTSAPDTPAPPTVAPVPSTRTPPAQIPTIPPPTAAPTTRIPATAAPSGPSPAMYAELRLEEAQVYTGATLDLNASCVVGQALPYRVTEGGAPEALAELRVASTEIVEWVYRCGAAGGTDAARRGGYVQQRDASAGGVGTIYATVTLAPSLAGGMCSRDAHWRVPDLVGGDGRVDVFMEPLEDGSTPLMRSIAFKPSSGAVTITASDELSDAGPLRIVVDLCAESFDTDATAAAIAMQALPIAFASTSASCDLSNYTATLAATARPAFPNAQQLVLECPPLPRALADVCNGVDIALTMGPAAAFASGIQPQVSGQPRVSVRVVGAATDPDGAARCTLDCGRNGRCISATKCKCDPGFTGDACGEGTMASQTTAAVAGAGAVAWVLQIALGGSLMVPVHSLTTLQVLYLASTMDCSAAGASDATARLRYLVFPIGIDVGSDDSADHLVFAMIAHAGVCALHGLAVGVAYACSSAVCRTWSRAAAKVYFPNLSVIMMYCFTVPLVAGVIRTGFGGWWLMGLLYTLVMTFAFSAACVWFGKTRMEAEPPNVEFFTMNLNNSSKNATRMLLNNAEGGMPGCLRAWLPCGFWTCRHLVDRSFLRRYSTLVAEFSPSCVHWYPLFTYARLCALAAIARQQGSGCVARQVVIIVLSIGGVAVVVLRRPFVCGGSDVVAGATSATFALCIIAFAWVDALVMPALGLLGACVLLAALWYIVAYFYTHRLYAADKRHAERQNRSAPTQVAPVSASGYVDVWVGAEVDLPQPVSGTAAAAPRGIPPSDNLSRRWCELRGGQVAVYTARSEVHAEYRADVDLTNATWHERGDPTDGTREAGFLFYARGPRKGDVIWIVFAEATPPTLNDSHAPRSRDTTERQWRHAVTEAEERAGGRRGSGGSVSGASEGEAGYLLGRNVARVGQEDRRGAYDFFGTPIPTTYGAYCHCIPHGSTSLSPADLEMLAPNVTLQRIGGPARLLMHCVDKKRLTKQQLAVWTAELAVLQRLRHAFVAEVFDAFEAPDAVCWVVPYCAYGSLHDRLAASGAMDEAAAAFYSAEVLLGLEHLHENNLLYRNLSPRDVFFCADGHVLLTDPGLPWSRVQPEKVGYVAPEVLQHGAATESTDLWALGAITYTMLHARAPFAAKDMGTTVRLALNTQPVYNPQLSAACAEFLRALLRCTGRVQDAHEVKAMPWFAAQGIEWEHLELRDPPPASALAAAEELEAGETLALSGTIAAVTSSGQQQNPLQDAFGADSADANRPSRRSPATYAKNSPKLSSHDVSGPMGEDTSGDPRGGPRTKASSKSDSYGSNNLDSTDCLLRPVATKTPHSLAASGRTRGRRDTV